MSLTTNGKITSQRKHRCGVVSCKVRKNSKNHLHCVPAASRLSRLWESALKQKLSPHMRVCSRHFRLEDYIPSRPGASRQHLKKNVVPFLNYIDAEEDCDISEQTGNASIELERIPNDCNNDCIDADEAGLKDLETIPDDWYISTEDYNTLEEDTVKLLDLIKSSNGFAAELTSSNCEMRGGLGCLGPFNLFPLMQKELFTVLDKFYEATFNSEVIYGKILTEVLIMAVRMLKQCTKTDAEHFVWRSSNFRVRDKEGL